MFKRFMRSPLVQSLAAFALAAYMVVVKYTTRWEVKGLDNIAPFMGNGEGLIVMTWHSRFLMLNAGWKKSYQKPHVLISRSRDGDIVAKTSQILGINAVRGSARRGKKGKGGQSNSPSKGPNKGGVAAFLAMQNAVDGGGCIVITADGPKGPRQRLGSGPLTLAKRTSAPLFSCIFSVKNRKQVNSWDKFIIPLPFGRGQIIWSPATYIDKDISDADFAALRAKLEQAMNADLDKADSALGHTLTLPQAMAEEIS